MRGTERRFGTVRIDRQAIRGSLLLRPSLPHEDMEWMSDAPLELRERVRRSLPAARVPAAVLVPLIERANGFSVLFTQRATTLRDHAGQISFPGGRIETDDRDPWSAALREAREEIGLDPARVEFAGYLPDHLIVSGFRVTPAVGFVTGDYTLRVEDAEVAEAFEVPLDYLLDEANHRERERRIGDASFTVYDIPFGSRRIWGATAGMVMTLRRMLLARAVSGG
ncbi:MAG TPA: CoA pyrophosphatase [Steroidobacteraceae bacterium]|nr:CoA pyrophosphatase [Steroidobacteraceae bacterium]